MTYLEKIFVALMFMIFINIWGHSQVSAQTEISVPIPEGWIGAIGSNTQQAVGVKSFATMGIRRVFITQVSTSGAFEVQGNDVSIILKIELMDGNVLDLPGTLTWRVASGNSILAFGIIPAAGSSVSYTYNSIPYSIYGATGTDKGSNIVLKKVGATVSYSDGSTISGNAAQVSSMLGELNDYLAVVNANKPQGPVTVNLTSSSCSAENFIITGTVTLAVNEVFEVEFDHKVYVYPTSPNLAIDRNTWTLTVPNNGQLAGIYNVNAYIINSDGYVLADSSADEFQLYGPPVINTQPQSMVIGLGGSATLSVTVGGGSGNFSYQWLNSDAQDGTYVPITEAVSASYNAPTSGSGTTYYKVQVIDNLSGCNHVFSEVVYVTVIAGFAFQTQPQSVISCVEVEGTTTLTCATSGAVGTVSYQWQSSATAGGTFINIEGASGASYDAPVATPGTIYYRVIATDSSGPVSIMSNEVSVTVNADPVISSGPNSSEVCVGADAILTVTATGGVSDLIFQWETSTTSDGTYSPIQGATGATYDAPTTTAGENWYRVIVSNGGTNCGSFTSAAVSVTVKDIPRITTQPSDLTVCAGETGSTTILGVVATGGGTLTYQWQSSESPTGPFEDISGATSAGYSVPTSVAGVTFYHVKIKLSETGCEVVSYSAVVTVNWPQQFQTKAGLDYASPRTWTDKSNWEQYNGSAWVDAVTYPGEITNSCSSPLVTIQDSHLMEISDADISIPNLEIKSTGKLSLKSTGKITVNGSYTAVSGAEIKILTNNQ